MNLRGKGPNGPPQILMNFECCFLNKNKRHVFFYTCLIAFLRVIHPFEEIRFLSFKANIAETVK